MNPVKEVIIKGLLDRINASPFVLVVEYTGMTVPEFSELRARLADNGAECHVAKNTYMRKALLEAGLPDTGDSLKGQTAFVTGESDVAAAAKVLKSFEKEFKKPAIKLGILDGDILDEAQVKAIADLPSREVLLATLLSTINAPASQLVRTLNEPGGSLARVIKAKFDQEG